MASKKQKIQKNEIIGFNKTGYMIFHIKGVNVMVDSDLAKLYGVVTGALTRAVKRNLERFPQDFMFQLSDEEFENLRCQTGISSSYGGRRYNPYVFTQEGVAMLSSVLRSPRAIQANIEIMRAFVRMKEMINANGPLSRKIKALEKKYDGQFKVVFDAIQQLMIPPEKHKHPIGFVWPKNDKKK